MSTPTGLPVSCQCGAISFHTPSPTPSGMAHCHCTECRKQSASAFGTSVYFPSDQVFPLSPELEEKLAVFTRPTDSGNTMHCYFCPKCGVRILHVMYDKDGKRLDKVSFKGGCVEGLDWKGFKHILSSRRLWIFRRGWRGLRGIRLRDRGWKDRRGVLDIGAGCSVEFSHYLLLPS